jgi:hypothetical protein
MGLGQNCDASGNPDSLPPLLTIPDAFRIEMRSGLDHQVRIVKDKVSRLEADVVVLLVRAVLLFVPFIPCRHLYLRCITLWARISSDPELYQVADYVERANGRYIKTVIYFWA